MHWVRGGDGLVVWSGRDLEDHPRAAEQLAKAIADIRATESRLPAFRPEPRGVALVHSPRSVAIAWLRDALLDGPTWPRRLPGYHFEHGTLERSQDSWLRFFEDQGLMPGSVPLRDVGRHLVRRFPLLVLNHTLLIDDRELERLHEYLDGGGSLLIHGDVGWLDGRGQERPEPLLPELLARSPRVLVAPDIIDEYPATRTRRAAARREVLEARLWAYLPSIRARMDRAPFEVTGDHASQLPWLRTWARDRQTGGWTCAAIPNAIGAVEQKRLEREIPLTVQTSLDVDIEWIQPPPALGQGDRAPGSGGAGAHPNPRSAVLAPGSAAVFRLVPRSRDD